MSGYDSDPFDIVGSQDPKDESVTPCHSSAPWRSETNSHVIKRFAQEAPNELRTGAIRMIMKHGRAAQDWPSARLPPDCGQLPPS